jgi:predicted glycoside hydrolase/deacetylase ChbG (UPF0249 family)
MMTTRLVTPFVLCADDYGLNPEVNTAILDLATKRRISATSVMSLSPGWPESAIPLKEVRSVIDIGLHLDLTSDFAMDDGIGESLSAWMLRSTARLLQRDALERVIEKQLDLFELHVGTAPDHVDGHQHVHQFPVIRDALIRVLSRRYASGPRPWLRISRAVGPTTDFKAQVITAMGAKTLERLAVAHGFAHSSHLSGIYDFKGSIVQYRNQLRQWLKDLPRGAVLMCHPAKGIYAQSPTPMASVWEYEVLSSGNFPDLLEETLTELSKGQMVFGM